MRKPFYRFMVLFIFLLFFGCGQPGDPETSTVSIRLAQPEAEMQGNDAIQEIPPDISRLTVSITVDDMETEDLLKSIEEEVIITSEMRSAGYILLDYNVPNGYCSINIYAYYGSEGQPAYYGHQQIELTGGSYDVLITMENA